MLSPKAFQRHVEASGGCVDFLFDDAAPFAQCHASSLVETADGVLFAAWFAGTKEKHPDVAIWLSRFERGAWEPPRRIAKVNETAHWNPVLFRDRQDMLYLFFKVGAGIARWQTYWMQSADHGRSWSEHAELVAGDVGGRGPVRCKPIILADGSWLAPASTEHSGWKPFADRSVDGGRSWQRSGDWPIDATRLPGRGAIQPTCWEPEPGRVIALMRSQGGRVWRSESRDHGRSWAPVEATALANNNSGLDALQWDDGRVLLVHNPVAANWGPRTPLVLAVGDAEGRSWMTAAAFEDAPEGEFSYPAIVPTRQGIAVSYTWRRRRIRCWQIPRAALSAL